VPYLAELGIGSLLTPDIVLLAACGWCGDMLTPSTMFTHAGTCAAAKDGKNKTHLALASQAML
jgi:hypothetical protein